VHTLAGASPETRNPEPFFETLNLIFRPETLRLPFFLLLYCPRYRSQKALVPRVEWYNKSVSLEYEPASDFVLWQSDVNAPSFLDAN